MKKLVGLLIGGLCIGNALLPLYTSAQRFGDTDHVSGIGVAGTEKPGASADLIQVVKNFINWGLSMLGFVALVLCLFGGFMITTAAGDDGKVSKGKKILTQAGIGLAVIALSGLIVNLIFYVIKGSAG